jgi:two-component system, OmpR family, alkaline phosphatase synthesis response regulator PhoP
MSKILIIEDNQLMREATMQALEREGHQVFGADDGPSGISLARSEKPDLILLDLMMPYMPGDEVARYLRYDEEMASIPIIVLTAMNQAELVLDLLAMKNVRDYLLKPTPIGVLRQRVKAVLAQAEEYKDDAEIVDKLP